MKDVFLVENKLLGTKREKVGRDKLGARDQHVYTHCYSLQGLMLKLKLQSFGHMTQTVSSLEKTLMLGKIEGRRRRGRQRKRWLDGITDSMDMGLSKL